MKKIKLISLTAIASIAFCGLIQPASATIAPAIGPITQTIQITNLLANKTLSNSGMTETDIVVSFYNGGRNACWSQRIDYQKDYTFHAANGYGCSANVNQIVVQPVPTAGKIYAYTGPYTATIDTTKFSTQMVINQDSQAPVFDNQTGLVTRAGTISSISQVSVK